MNQKIAVWKRKLAKEKWKNQKDVWEKISTPSAPHKEPDWPDLTDHIKEITKNIDFQKEFSISKFVDEYILRILKSDKL